MAVFPIRPSFSFILSLYVCALKKSFATIRIQCQSAGDAATKTEHRFRRAYHFNFVVGGKIFVLRAKVKIQCTNFVQFA